MNQKYLNVIRNSWI